MNFHVPLIIVTGKSKLITAIFTTVFLFTWGLVLRIHLPRHAHFASLESRDVVVAIHLTLLFATFIVAPKFDSGNNSRFFYFKYKCIINSLYSIIVIPEMLYTIGKLDCKLLNQSFIKKKKGVKYIVVNPLVVPLLGTRLL